MFINVILLIAISGVAIASAANYCTATMKKFGGDFSYCYKGNSNAIIQMTQAEMNLIVKTHNDLRAKVANGEVENQPKATNMQKMIWDPALAHAAQMWAENCTGTHDANPIRGIPGQYGVGQNLYMSTHEDPWDDAVKAWFGENAWFKFGSGTTSGKEVGHYTQVVWATSSRVGCGRAHCPKLSYEYIYYCNYGPAGNMQPKQNDPYKTGTTASDCPNTKSGGLCNCGGKACYNSGVLDPNTCKCNCYSGFGPQNNFDANCGVECSKAGDNPSYPCDKMSLANCNMYQGAYLACPISCKVCSGSNNAPTTKMTPTTQKPKPSQSGNTEGFRKAPTPKTPSTQKPKHLWPRRSCTGSQCEIDVGREDGKVYCVNNGSTGEFKDDGVKMICTCSIDKGTSCKYFWKK